MGFERLSSLVVGLIMAAAAVAVCILTMWVTWNAARGKLNRNQWTGIRTPATMRSDAAWVTGHRAAARSAPAYISLALGICALTVWALLQGWTFGVLLIGISALVVVLAACGCQKTAPRPGRTIGSSRRVVCPQLG